MIRTRDLVLFLICLVFLGVLIVSTIVRPELTGNLPIPDTWQAADTTAGERSGEVATTAGIDRAGNIARLREQIAADTSSIVPEPDTFVEDVLLPEVDEAAPDDAPGVRTCLYPDDILPKLANWPLSGVTVTAASGARVVSYTETITVEAAADASATTTPTMQTETITQTIASLPLFPGKTPSPSCVPSQVIGVTTGGTMMFNTDTAIWQNVDANTLIGYARDGFPIYGRYSGELDACGGYDHPAGYRYSVSSDRNYLIGCFTATPQSFNL